MHDVYLGLGANLENPIEKVRKAMKEIACLDQVQFVQASPLYRTKPVSPLPQNDYINAVCHIQTPLDPLSFFSQIRSIEKKLGKKNKPKFAPRVIDIDILLYGKLEINENDLIIPHLLWSERLFTLVPLMSITEEVQLPNNTFCKLEEMILRLSNSYKEQLVEIAYA